MYCCCYLEGNLMQKGFTLIELMIVVAIIGVLASIAIPMYQTYVAKSQITVAIAELNGAKPQYELIINNGSASGDNDFSVPNMFFSGAQSKTCVYAVNAPDNSGNSSQALVCKLQNSATIINGSYVYLSRDLNGTWRCGSSIGIEAKLKPVDCV